MTENEMVSLFYDMVPALRHEYHLGHWVGWTDENGVEHYIVKIDSRTDDREFGWLSYHTNRKQFKLECYPYGNRNFHPVTHRFKGDYDLEKMIDKVHKIIDSENR